MDATPDTAADRDALAFRARVAVSVAFLLLGAGPGLWAVHIPLVQERLGINPAILGLALLVMAIGAVIAMPIMGWAVGHVGSRIPTAAGMILYMATIPLPILAGSVPFFFVALFFFGLLMGGLDVVGNVQAAEVETLRGKPTMSSFHALLLDRRPGRRAGRRLRHRQRLGRRHRRGGGVHRPPRARRRWPQATCCPSEKPIDGAPRFALPNRAVLGLGILAFLCFAIEGAVTDWSALFLTSAKAATPEHAAFGYAAYAFAMAVFRLFGDPIVVRLGPKLITVGGSLLCVLGLAIALASPWPLVGAARLRPRRPRRGEHRAGAVLGRRPHAGGRLRRRRLRGRHAGLLRLPRLPADPRLRRRPVRPVGRARDRAPHVGADGVARQPAEPAATAGSSSLE